MKLYKLINNLGIWWVLADHPTEAEGRLTSHLDEADYGFTRDRKVIEIHLIAEECDENKRFLSGKYLIK